MESGEKGEKEAKLSDSNKLETNWTNYLTG